MDFTKLEKGKIIDAQPGFVDSWNRMVDCWNNLTGAGKAFVNWPLDTVPTIDVPKDDEEDEDDEEDDENLDDIPELVLPPFDPVAPSKALPQPFDIVDGKVVNCTIPCPIETKSAAEYEISGSDPVFLHVNLSGGNYVLTVDQTPSAQSASHAQFKLYEFDGDGKVTLDCRPKVIPVFAL